LVTLVNFSGHSSEKSGSTLSRSSWLCSSATPLTLTAAHRRQVGHPHRALGCSAMIDIRRTRISSPGNCVARTSARNSSLIR
jgi:hypothetical protein